jgi:hypothetical protein
MKLKAVFWPAVFVVLLVGCGPPMLQPPTKSITVSMLWECGLPEHFGISDFVKNNPAAKPVTLHFARYPNIVDIEAQPGLCDALKTAGKRVVPVTIQPIGVSGGKFDGYNILSVNSYPVGSPYSLENGNLGGYAPPLEELLR